MDGLSNHSIYRVKKMLNKKNITIIGIIIILSVTPIMVWQLNLTNYGVPASLTINDDFNRLIEIKNYPPTRIVSLAPSCTEILYALNLGDNIVGIDEYSDFPSKVKEELENGNLTTVGSFSEISIETVIGLEPDLIVATGGVQRLIGESLESRGYPVILLYPKNFDGVLQDISILGKATGRTVEAEALVNEMQDRAKEIADKTADVSRPRVYIEYSQMGGFWTFGSEAFATELINKAGGLNVFAGFAGSYMSTSTEEALKANPEIIIISKGYMSISTGLSPQVLRERSGWDEITAIKENQIFEIEESIISREGPRIIEGLEELAKIIHPELFN
jgi:iron complex transport system substrate-binding protein